jgi:hypothetical protein
MTPAQREAAERLAGELDRIGRHQPGVLMADDGSVWHPANLLLPAAALLRELLAEPQGEPVAWRTEFDRVQAQFEAETLRTSSLSDLLRRWVALHDGDHEPGPWSRGCHRCALVAESRALMASPINTHPPQQRKPLTREQIDTVWSSLGSFTDRESDYRIFARAIERSHGIGEPT